MTANWTAPRTWTIGELVTKDIMDTHVRDNLEYLYGLRGKRKLELISLDTLNVASPLIVASDLEASAGGTPALYLGVRAFNAGTLSAIARSFNIPDSYTSGGRIVFEHISASASDAGSAFVFAARIASMGIGDSFNLKVPGTTSYATVTVGAYMARQVGTVVFSDMDGGTAGDLVTMQFWREGTAATDTATNMARCPSIRFEWD